MVIMAMAMSYLSGDVKKQLRQSMYYPGWLSTGFPVDECNPQERRMVVYQRMMIIGW